MDWLEELNTLLNPESSGEFEKRWAKYKDYEFGLEIEDIFNSSIGYSLYPYPIDSQDICYQTEKVNYSQRNNNYALAA